MAKAEELSSQMRPVYKIADQTYPLNHIGQGSTFKGLPYCPGQVRIFKMAKGQVKVRVRLPDMAGKISSFNFGDTLTQGKSNIVSTVLKKL